MHALVTGGAGFIGSNLSRKLLEIGYRVTVLDNLSTGEKGNIPEGCNFIDLDLTEKGFTESIPRDVTHVFHLAAQSSGEISFEDPRNDLETNVSSTLELLSWSHRISVERFVFTSSMSVYGDVPNEPITEERKIAPKSFYGVGKAASEYYIQIFTELGLNTVVLRLFNIYGPGQDVENMKQGMLSIFLGYLLRGEDLKVKGSLERFRDFVFIEDCVNAIIKAAESENLTGTFNICSGKKTTVGEAIDCLLKNLGKENHSVIIEEGTPGDQFGIFGNPSKTTEKLGWRNRTSFSNGVSKLVDSLNKK